VSLVKHGIEGAEEITAKMIELRNNPPKEINGEEVVLIEDYQTSIAKNMQSHETHNINLPKSNVLIYYTENGPRSLLDLVGQNRKLNLYQCKFNSQNK